MTLYLISVLLLAACGRDGPTGPDLTPEAEKLVGLWRSTSTPPSWYINSILSTDTNYRLSADGTFTHLKWGVVAKWSLLDTVFALKHTLDAGIIAPGLYTWEGDPAYDPYKWEKSGRDEWTVTITHRLKFATDDQVMIDFPGDYMEDRYRILVRQEEED